jgi:hypothetical protein
MAQNVAFFSPVRHGHVAPDVGLAAELAAYRRRQVTVSRGIACGGKATIISSHVVKQRRNSGGSPKSRRENGRWKETLRVLAKRGPEF